MLQVYQFPCLADNYGFLAHDPATGETATIDTPDADAILAAAADKGWRITQIWNTHWHPDHAGGNAAIKAATGALVTGPAEVARIGQAPDRVVTEGDTVALGGLVARVLDVGGHTLGHVAFVFDDEKIGFVATPCSRSAAGACSRARRSRCGRACRRSPPCRTKRRSIARTNTRNPMRASP